MSKMANMPKNIKNIKNAKNIKNGKNVKNIKNFNKGKNKIIRRNAIKCKKYKKKHKEMQ